MRDQEAAAWQVFVAQNTPPSSVAQGGIDLSVDPWQLAIDAPKFRDSAQRQINAQLRKGGVKVIAGPEVPAPDANSTALLASYFNFGQFTYPIVIWELGTVQVSGTYKQITENVRAWSHMKGFLAVVDGLSITGTGTPLTGTYNLVVVGYLKGRNFFGGVNDAGVTAASTGGGLAGGRLGGMKPAGGMSPAGAPGGGGMSPMGAPGGAGMSPMGAPGGGKPSGPPSGLSNSGAG